jgi:hypothetical protein
MYFWRDSSGYSNRRTIGIPITLWGGSDGEIIVTLMIRVPDGCQKVRCLLGFADADASNRRNRMCDGDLDLTLPHSGSFPNRLPSNRKMRLASDLPPLRSGRTWHGPAGHSDRPGKELFRETTNVGVAVFDQPRAG